MPSRLFHLIAALLAALFTQSARAAEVVIPLAEATDSIGRVNLILFHEGVASASVEGDLEFVPPLRIAAGDDGLPRCAPFESDTGVTANFSFSPPGCLGAQCTGMHFSTSFAPPTSRDLLFAHCDVDVAQNSGPGFFELPLRDVRVIDSLGHDVETRASSGGVSVPELPRHATISIDNIEGRPGDTLQLSVTLDTTIAARIERVGMQVVGDSHLRISFDEETGRAFCNVNPAIQKDQSDFTGSSLGGFGAHILGTTRLIPTGSLLFTCPVEILADAPPGLYPLACIGQDAYDTSAGFIATTCVPGSVNVLPGLPGTPTATRVPTPSPEATATAPPTMTRRASAGSGCDASSHPDNGYRDMLFMVLLAIPLSRAGRRAMLTVMRLRIARSSASPARSTRPRSASS